MTPFDQMMRRHFGIKPKRVTAVPSDLSRAIVLEVQEETGVAADDILGPSREHRIAFARQRVYTRLRNLGFGYSVIGRAMKRDRTTILHGVRQAAAR